MRTAGLDVGTRTIGVAVSDEGGIIAQGVTAIERTEISRDLAQLKKLLNSFAVARVVVGLPKNMSGDLGPQARLVLKFVEVMKKEISLPVSLWDERLSTVAAERSLLEANLSRRKRKRLKDKLSATIILQNYLDSQQFLKDRREER